jgi:hypothetical protein
MGTENFTENESALNEEHHGFWMANTLKEVAPGCEIYALCTTDFLISPGAAENAT